MRNLLTFLMLLGCSQIAAQSWYWINPSTGHHHLNDISFLQPGPGIAVADNGVILLYNDSIWTKAESPVTDNLNAVYYLSPTLAWAVGNNGTILKFNGSAWVQQTSPVTVTLNDVCFTDETHGWAVGNTILFYDGNSWQVQQDAENLTTVSFATQDEGWAAGLYNSLYHYTNGNWEPDFSFVGGNYIMFSSVQMSGPSSVLLNGSDMEGYGLLYHFNGDQWLPLDAGGINSGLSMRDNEHGFGIQNRIAFFADTYPSVYRFTGDNRIKETSFAYDRLLTSVDATGENEAYVSDTTGFVYHGSDGIWAVSNGFTSDSILDIDFTRANNGYFACGTDGIWHYNAGNWTNVLKVEGFRFNEIEFSDDNYGFATAYKLTDIPGPFGDEIKMFGYENGIWSELSIPVTEGIWEPATSVEISFWNTLGISSYNMIYSLSEAVWDTTFLSLNDSITELRFMDPLPVNQNLQGALPEMEELWLSIKRLDGEMKGAIYFNNYMNDVWITSYETTTGAFNDLCVADYMNIYAVGDNGLIAHFDGQTWMEFAPVTSEDLLSVYMNDENRGWACGRNGTLLRYNGMAWSVEQSNTWNDLFKVTDLQNGLGLLGGRNGTLLSTQPELPVDNTYSSVVNTVDVLTIIPNPAKDNALIQFNFSGDSPVELKMTDLTGRLIFEKSITTTGDGIQTVPVNVQHIRDGIYLIQISSGRKFLTGKMLIQK
ncbi:MAG: hypothetical protein FD166_2281 [Bacteroidetes bacterium]|nr:MAG: hypothetical protein FD166_2281 [Bacteroidota bacterium]